MKKRWTPSQIGSLLLIAFWALAVAALVVARLRGLYGVTDGMVGGAFLSLLTVTGAANFRSVNSRVDGIIDGVPLACVPLPMRSVWSAMIAAWRLAETQQQQSAAQAAVGSVLGSVPVIAAGAGALIPQKTVDELSALAGNLSAILQRGPNGELTFVQTLSGAATAALIDKTTSPLAVTDTNAPASSGIPSSAGDGDEGTTITPDSLPDAATDAPDASGDASALPPVAMVVKEEAHV